MHCCFVTVGAWSGNAGFVRLGEFGSELAEDGLRVSAVTDNEDCKRNKLQLYPKDERCM